MAGIARIGLLGALCGLTACGAGDPVGAEDKARGVSKSPDKAVNSPYDLADRCFVLKAAGSPVKRTAAGFSTTAGSSPELFYMKAAGLAFDAAGEVMGSRYVFYTSDRRFMAGHTTALPVDGTVSADQAPSDGADWTITRAPDGSFAAGTLERRLGLNSAGQLVLSATAAPLQFEAAKGCAVYPEMPTGIDDPTYKALAPDGSVIGFAEVHAHMAMGHEMSDGSRNVGPSAGGVMYGHAVNRFGVIEALKDCVEMHGPEGSLSPENIVLDNDPTQTHDTVGWPSFIDWPAADSMLHQQMYYKWVERTYKAGLRVMVIHGTNIEALCDVGKKTAGNKTAECRDMEVGVQQVQYLYDIQNYVDAQSGGPGKGWFRIVGTPAEARAVIAEGKLAVIPGLEFSNIFKCNVTFVRTGPDSWHEIRGCDKATIDEQIERAWNLGVRQVFAFHDVDSALGGTGIFQPLALNLVNFYGTGKFWETYDCPDGGEGDAYFYNAGSRMYHKDAPSGFGNDPITEFIVENFDGTLPTYPTGRRQCNARGLTDLGQYALEKMMKKGFVLDIDHAELSIKGDMLAMGSQLSPAYPAVSGHGGHGGLSTAQARQLLAQGGLIYPAIENGKKYVAFVEKVRSVWPADAPNRLFAVGYGADTNGLANLPEPRGLGSEPVKYPFKLFQGSGWGSQFRAAGIKPMTVQQLRIEESGKAWSSDEHGMAHYGLIPDLVEEIRIEGGEPATTALYNSAEAYLRMWEQTLQASAAARQLPEGQPAPDRP